MENRPTQPASITSTDSANQTPTSSRAAEQTPDQVESLFAERSARLDAKRKKDAEEEKRRRAEKAKQKADAESAGRKANDPHSKHMESLKKRQREAREERQRILTAIEDDKAARRAVQVEKEAKKQSALQAAGQAAAATEDAAEASSSKLPADPSRSEYCSIQVRLLDGSTLRSRFSSSDTLGTDVRRWVDENRRDGKQPYTFKVFLGPPPNGTIDATEEDRTLRDLGLTPSSTLILVPSPIPVSSIATAYPQRGGNPISRFLLFIYALLTAPLATIGAFFSSVFQSNTPQRLRGEEPPAREGAATSAREDSRAKDFERRRERRDDQQYYNGNSVSACNPLSPLDGHCGCDFN